MKLLKAVNVIEGLSIIIMVVIIHDTFKPLKDRLKEQVEGQE